MNRLHHRLYIFLLLLLVSESAIMFHNKAQESKYSRNVIVQKLKTAWKNNWVKAGTITATCALAYAAGVKYNFFAVASAATIVVGNQNKQVEVQDNQSKDQDNIQNNVPQHNVTMSQDTTNTNTTTTEKPQEKTVEEAQLLQQKSYKEYGAEIAEQGKDVLEKATSTVKAVATWFITPPECDESTNSI